MRRPTVVGCLGALVALGVMAVVVALPGNTGELRSTPRIETFITAACGGSSPCLPSERARWLKALDRLLAERMPDMPQGERTRLASVIYEEAARASLDPAFVLALIAVESGFKYTAESARGARGLMQLRPDTLEREALRSRLHTDDQDDPAFNVRAGVRYFARLARAFGSVDLALMAYNAGPNRILGYLKNDGEVPERFLVYPQRIHREHARLKSCHGMPGRAEKKWAARTQPAGERRAAE